MIFVWSTGADCVNKYKFGLQERGVQRKICETISEFMQK